MTAIMDWWMTVIAGSDHLGFDWLLTSRCQRHICGCIPAATNSHNQNTKTLHRGGVFRTQKDRRRHREGLKHPNNDGLTILLVLRAIG